MGQGTGSALLFEILNRIQITVPPHVMLGFALASTAGRNRHQHSLTMRKGLTGRAVLPLIGLCSPAVVLEETLSADFFRSLR